MKEGRERHWQLGVRAEIVAALHKQPVSCGLRHISVQGVIVCGREIFVRW